MWTDLGQLWQTSEQLRPNLTEFGRSGPNLTETPKSGPHRPISVNSGQLWSNFGPSRPIFSQFQHMNPSRGRFGANRKVRACDPGIFFFLSLPAQHHCRSGGARGALSRETFACPPIELRWPIHVEFLALVSEPCDAVEGLVFVDAIPRCEAEALHDVVPLAIDAENEGLGEAA